jgi:multidrug resistance efflux pump
MPGIAQPGRCLWHFKEKSMSAIKTASWIAGCLLLAGAWVRAGEAPATQPVTQPATQPNVHVVKAGTLVLEIQTEGTFQPAEPFEVKHKFKVYSGPLAVVAAAGQGAAVKSGEVLLDCERTNLNWTMEETEGAAAAARAAYKKAQADAELAVKSEALALRMQEDAVKNAEAALKWWNDVDGPQMLLSADLSVKYAQDNVGDQEDELDQLKKMYKTEDLTNATADIVIKRAVRQSERAKVSLDMQKARREKTKANDYPIARQKVVDALEQIRQQLASLKLTQEQAAVLRKNSLNSSRINLEQAEKKLAELKEDAAVFTIKAPFDGIVYYSQLPEDQRALKAGEKIAAGGTIMRLMAAGKLKIDVNLGEAQALWVEPGMKARVTPTGVPTGVREGVCGVVVGGPRGAPAVFSYQLPITFDGQPYDPRLVPGMKASVKIDAGRLENVLLVPINAVTNSSVTVRNADGTTAMRKLVLGKSDGQQVVVLKGLTAGEEVMLAAKK